MLKSKIALVVPTVVGALSASAPMIAHASEANNAGDAVSGAVSLVTGIVPLFTTFPMNIFLGVGLASAGIALFSRAKGASGGKR